MQLDGCHHSRTALISRPHRPASSTPNSASSRRLEGESGGGAQIGHLPGGCPIS